MDLETAVTLGFLVFALAFFVWVMNDVDHKQDRKVEQRFHHSIIRKQFALEDSNPTPAAPPKHRRKR